MAKLPDGKIAIFKEDRKHTKIDIEMAELVMCKNCIHRDPEDHKCDKGWITSNLPMPNDFYCAYGETKGKVIKGLIRSKRRNNLTK